MKSIRDIILEYLRIKDISQAELARLIGESQQNLHAKLKNNDLPSDFIIRVSRALNHNFLDDYAKELDKELRTDRRTKAPVTETDKAAYLVENLQELTKNIKDLFKV